MLAHGVAGPIKCHRQPLKSCKRRTGMRVHEGYRMASRQALVTVCSLTVLVALCFPECMDANCLSCYHIFKKTKGAGMERGMLLWERSALLLYYTFVPHEPVPASDAANCWCKGQWRWEIHQKHLLTQAPLKSVGVVQEVKRCIACTSMFSLKKKKLGQSYLIFLQSQLDDGVWVHFCSVCAAQWEVICCRAKGFPGSCFLFCFAFCCIM